jgi:glycosyltransferase involved in cell wall biosynthesis
VKPLVSILIPAYNAERWIGDTINSALQQTWDNKEVIVVDDGSRDTTLQVASRLASKLVKVVAQDNGGACAARNKALEFAQGDYIQWLDADDLLDPEKISLQLQGSDAEPDSLALLTSAWGRFYFRPERATFRPDSLWTDLHPVDWLVTKFEQGVWMNPGAWLVSRKLTDSAGPWDGRLALSGDDDGEYMCRLVAGSTCVKFSPRARAYYRVGNGGLSWRKSDTALDSFFLATTLCLHHLRSLEDSERTRTACLTFLQTRLRYFYWLKPAIVEAANTLASELGGTLSPPLMSRRFRLMSRLVGWETAMKMKNGLWTTDILCHRNWDKALGMMSSVKDAPVKDR